MKIEISRRRVSEGKIKIEREVTKRVLESRDTSFFIVINTGMDCQQTQMSRLTFDCMVCGFSTS